ncbi:MAG: response regulator, partial [Pseudomonadota bacterium]
MSTTAPNRRRVLIVDDDAALTETLSEQLTLHEEFSVVLADNGAAALEAIKDGHFDIVLLDVGLPDMDGRDVCKLMRRAGLKTPILMLTAADSDADTILGLDAGAND